VAGGSSTINPCWTMVRTQGQGREAMPYVRRPAEHPGIAGRQLDSLLHRQCPGCAGALRDDDELVTVPLGPGANTEARAAQRRGEWFDAVAVVCHRACAGDSRLAAESPALKLAMASSMIAEAAEQVSARVKAHGDAASSFDPTPNLLDIADSTERVSKDLSGWEEQHV
jgi:hypothetical protein